MDTITSVSASDVSAADLQGILADYVALEQVHVLRQLLVRRCGLLALVVFVAARLIPGMSVYGRWVPLILFILPPVCAWLVELRLERRLAPKKVIKSP